MRSHTRKLWVLGPVLSLCAVIGCTVEAVPDPGTSDEPDAEGLEPMATMQETISVADFEAIVLGDPQLQVVVDMVRLAEGAGEFTAAGRVAGTVSMATACQRCKSRLEGTKKSGGPLPTDP